MEEDSEVRLDDEGRPIEKKKRRASAALKMDPSITSELPEHTTVFLFAVGVEIRAIHKDGKFYQASILLRGIHKDSPAGCQGRYLIHFNNWGRRFDEWVDESHIRSLTSQSPRRARNGKRDRDRDRSRCG